MPPHLGSGMLAGYQRKKFWTVIRTKFDEEKSALKNITSQEFKGYLPRYRARVDAKGVRKVLPLFPGYLFVQIHRDQDWSPLRHTRGVHSLFYSVEGAPAHIRNEDVKRFQDMEDERGYVVLVDEEPPVFSIGDCVIAFGGMCAGHMGSFAGRGSTPSRGNVIFEMMSNAVKLEVSLYDLA